MYEIESMIVPQKIETLRNLDGPQNVAYRLVNGKVLERVIYKDNVARVYRQLTDVHLRTHFTSKPIINVFYHDFGHSVNSNLHLCIASEDELKLICIETNECHTIVLPIKVQLVLSTTHGLLLVRSENDDSETFRGSNILYSLSHPYSELLPVLCRLKGEENKPFIFMRRKIQLIPSLIESNLILGYDLDENNNYLFLVRHCTDLEKRIARENLMESMTAVNYSQVDTMRHTHSASPFMTDTNKSDVTPIPMANSIVGTPNCSQSNWKNRFNRTPGLGMSPMLSRIHEQSQAESATSRLFSSLSQHASQSQHMDCTKATSILSLITGEVETEFDHNAVELSLDCIWTDEMSRLGGRSPSRLPIFTALQASGPVIQRNNRARTKLEKEITEQFAKNLCVTNKPSQTFITSDLNDRKFFVFTIPGNNTVKLFSYENFNVTSKMSTFNATHAAPLFGTRYWIATQNSPILFTLYSGTKKIADLTISCWIREPEMQVLNKIHQLICRDGNEFEMIADFRSAADSSPSKEPVLKKARRGIVSPKKRQLVLIDPFESVITSIRYQSESQPLPPSFMDNSPAPKSLQAVYSQPSTSSAELSNLQPLSNKSSQATYHLIRVRLNLNLTTSMGSRLHDAIMSALSDKNKLDFEKEWLCKNVYRFVQNEFSNMIELELAFLFETVFEAIGINPVNFPFMRLIRKAKEINNESQSLGNSAKVKKDNDVDYPFLQEFVSRLELDDVPPVAEQVVEARPLSRKSFINLDHGVLIFKALHEQFDSLKRNKDLCVLRARQFMAQPLYILAGFYSIQKALNFYAELFPELRQLRVVPLKNQPRISLNEHTLLLDPIDHLCESFETEFATKKNVQEPILTNTQRNKLKVLPTQKEIARWIKLRWPTDIRVSNVETMLDSSKPVLIPDLRVSSTMSDAQLRDFQEKFLLNVALRTISRSFGSALLNFHSRQAEPMEVAVTEKICLHGKISPSNMNFEYPLQEQAPAKTIHRQMMEWANFYNGVSRGLSTILNCGDTKNFGLSTQSVKQKDLKRVEQVLASQTQRQIAPELQIHRNEYQSQRQTIDDDDGPSVVDWEWVFSKIKENEECSPALAGFILAAGLSGQNMSVNPFDLHEFLSLSDKLVVISLLLGTSVAYRGTSNFYINKMIYAHLPFLLQPTLCDFQIKPVVQTVALLSLGCLFANSMNSQLTNDLLNQMSKETFFETDLASERYAYVLSAGFAVGLINLGRGREIELMERMSSSNNHLRFYERLFILLNGGRRDLCIVNYQKDLCGIAQKGCCSCGMSRSDQKFQPNQHYYHHRQRADCITAAGSGGGGAAGAAGNPSTVTSNVAAASSHVCELTTINIHLSSPAACATFALVYMRTNLEHIAKKLVIPSDVYSIRLIRPDIIMLRTLASCLVMFDSITSTNEWLAKQTPYVLRGYLKKNASLTGNNADPDLSMLLRSAIYVRTGACFAMALKYTSTRDERATKILLQWFCDLVDDYEKDEEWESKTRICGTNTYMNCINAMMSALAIVNAGSGDIALVKQFRRVRNYNTQFTGVPKEGPLYSTHVIANMCLGLLFLGNGRYGLSSSNMSLASLLIAFFPIYGHSIYDNRCYFQGFRFLWTLAVESRFLITVAEGYQETIVAPLEIGFKDENTKPIVDKTPYLLPPLELISIIRIKAPDFQSIDLDLQKAEDMRVLQDVLTNLSGRLPLKKRRRACGSHEFRVLDPKVLVENDLDLNDNCSEHSFLDEADEVIAL